MAATTAAATSAVTATTAAVAATSSSLSKEQHDYTEVKQNYDNMFEEFETDILLSMEEMQKMGKTSDRMEERLNTIQNRSSTQSQRFRAVKEGYKSLGADLENRLKNIAKKREEEEKEEEEKRKKEAKEKEEEEQEEEKEKEMELQNALMSSLEGKANEIEETDRVTADE